MDSPRENWKIFHDTHEAIISRKTFELVQKMRKQRRRWVKSDIVGLFQGLVYCADCGHRHYYNGYGANERYYCSGSISRNCACDNAHSISETKLSVIVLNDFCRVLTFAKNHESELVEFLREKSALENSRNLANEKKELTKVETRFRELDKIISGLVESNILGKISDERFAKLSGEYEHEQMELSRKIENLKANLVKQNEKNQDISQFVSLVKQITEPYELTPLLIRELLERIELGRITKVNGKRTQEVKLIYRLVGDISGTKQENKTAGNAVL